MKTINRFIVPISILFIGVLMLIKGLQLWSIGDNVDGDGIGITFLFFEINDTVLTKDIPKYATIFFIAGTITILTSLIVLLKTVKLQNSK
ncbi:hypothetical protein [Longirhabdus pacifica]|uniref:hypothetical protein n=1 Tax=Longirhabdus pacifica TaxID=2305227 RepID=UPI0010091E02|nr:hypothetical protein [Longirhabdus pacifica]